MPSPWKVSPSPSLSDSISLVNWRSMETRNELVPPRGVLNDFGAIEGGAEHRGVRVLAAQSATDAAVDHRRHRVAAQRIGVVLDGQRRAARQADARVVAGAGVFVHAVLHSYGSLSFSQILGDDGPELALPLELALALGDDHLETLVVGLHRLLERLRLLA